MQSARRICARLGLRKVSFEQLVDGAPAAYRTAVKLERGGQGVQDPAVPDNGKVRPLLMYSTILDGGNTWQPSTISGEDVGSVIDCRRTAPIPAAATA